MNIDYTKDYNSTRCGKFRIVEYLGKEYKGGRMFKIRFNNSGTVKEARLDHILNGNVYDPYHNIDFNKVYNSRFGKYIIISLCDESRNCSRLVRVRFLDTGCEKIVRLDHALTGNIKDDTIPSVCGIGEYGDHIEKDYHAKNIKLYGVWNGILRRCYNVNHKEYSSYGALGVRVCDSWLTFTNFVTDVKTLPGYDKYLSNPTMYQLDKDLLQQNIPTCNRVYSKDTCVWLNKYDNHNLSILEKDNGRNMIGLYDFGNGLYRVSCKDQYGNSRYLGMFSNVDAARNVYNLNSLIYNKYENIPLLNKCIPMTIPEITRYTKNEKYLSNIADTKRQMCHVINKDV